MRFLLVLALLLTACAPLPTSEVPKATIPLAVMLDDSIGRVTGLRVVTATLPAASELTEDVLKMALLDLGWIPLESAPGTMTAELLLREHFVKISIAYRADQLTFTLLESRDLEQAPCLYQLGGKSYQGPCIHTKYYSWLNNIVFAMPLASAKLMFLRHLDQESHTRK